LRISALKYISTGSTKQATSDFLAAKNSPGRRIPGPGRQYRRYYHTLVPKEEGHEDSLRGSISLYLQLPGKNLDANGFSEISRINKALFYTDDVEMDSFPRKESSEKALFPPSSPISRIKWSA